MIYLCNTGDVEHGNARSFTAEGKIYIVVNSEQTHYVYLNQCPHLGIPLEWLPDDFMDPDGDLIRCSTHGALFLPDTGECISGPCAGESLTAAKFSVIDNKIFLA